MARSCGDSTLIQFQQLDLKTIYFFLIYLMNLVNVPFMPISGIKEDVKN